VDKDRRPLVIDQPEENLDNQTVYSVLVPAIKDVKQARQIVLVTHNPNIAVVCDADQIVEASIDKGDGNRVRYHTGSIESSALNRAVVDILEGTRPAFRNRGSKYHKS
jgi:ABC-type transport system involved in cytochrome bd biosynthesis fused ATPase/permease subunit